MIATGKDAVPRPIAFTAGVFAVSLVGGLLLVLGPGQVLLGSEEQDRELLDAYDAATRHHSGRVVGTEIDEATGA